MHVDLKMPDLATTESEVKVTRWLVDVGQAVVRGQPVVEVETDKAAMEVEAYLDGTVDALLAQAGDVVEAGQAIARLVVPDGQATTGPAPSAPRPVVAPSPAALPAAPPKGGLFARNRAAATGQPAARPTPAEPASGASAPLALGPAARTAARRLQESKQTIPHFYLQRSAAAVALQARRRAAQPQRLAWDAFFVRAVALALQEFPRLARRWEEGSLVAPATDAIGVAVDVDGDLFVVSIPAAAEASLEAISGRLRAEVERLRRGEPEARRLTPNVMTVTNLGADGVEAFAAIINPPEAAVLAIGRIGPVVVARAGQPVVEERVTLTLSVDHRVASGRYAAGFLARVVTLLEDGVP